MSQTTLGIIGAPGLLHLDGLADLRRISVDTPFGTPSSQLITGRIDDVRVLYISRHGEAHEYSPCAINYRANIFALKSLGAQWCLSLNAVRSLTENIAPGTFVIPEQFIDLTHGRCATFFSDGICAHVNLSTPVCSVLKDAAFHAASKVCTGTEIKVHDSGTYICIEGPALPTRAESVLYRTWGGDVLGMTAMPEVKLAREAQLAYCVLAVAGEYDSWRPRAGDKEMEQIYARVGASVALTHEIVVDLASRICEAAPSPFAAESLSGAIMTDPQHIPPQVREDLKPIIEGYGADD